MEEQDAFDKWIEERFGSSEQTGVSPEVFQWLWETWCAACESCAQIAERTYEGSNATEEDSGFTFYGENSAEEIRSSIRGTLDTMFHSCMMRAIEREYA